MRHAGIRRTADSRFQAGLWSSSSARLGFSPASHIPTLQLPFNWETYEQGLTHVEGPPPSAVDVRTIQETEERM